MNQMQSKCVCGEYANLFYIAKLGRIDNKLVTVLNVPTYNC